MAWLLAQPCCCARASAQWRPAALRRAASPLLHPRRTAFARRGRGPLGLAPAASAGDRDGGARASASLGGSSGHAPASHQADTASTEIDAETRRQIPSYGLREWARHRSGWRYLRHLRSAPASHILRSLVWPALFSVAAVALLWLYDTQRLASWPGLGSIGLGPLGLSSSALSLLLVFRTNSSYQRFVDARTLWGSIVNRSRDLVRCALVYIPAVNAVYKPVLVRWVVALAHCVRLHVRAPREATEKELARILLPQELELLVASAHRPNYCLQVLTETIAAAVNDPHNALRLDEDLRTLEESIGGTERLYRTPIPISYTRHTSRLLLLWLAWMPAALYTEMYLRALVVAPLLVIILFGIDEIGVQLEEPMGILPLKVLCEAVEAQTGELLERDSEVKALVAGLGRTSSS